MAASEQPRVFSGVQPTGSLHLGNYLGAIRNFVDIQDDYDAVYCIVDLHAITVWQEPAELKQNILDVAAAYLACGIDPKRSTVFVQSEISGHAELAWILNCVARIGWLNRMPQFKEKAGKIERMRPSASMFTLISWLLTYSSITRILCRWGTIKNSIWKSQGILLNGSTMISVQKERNFSLFQSR